MHLFLTQCFILQRNSDISLSIINLMSFFAVCPIGSYLNAANGGACELCPDDTYSTEINSNSCTNCPAGTNGQQNACGKNILSTTYIFIKQEFQPNQTSRKKSQNSELGFTILVKENLYLKHRLYKTNRFILKFTIYIYYIDDIHLTIRFFWYTDYSKDTILFWVLQ